LSLDLARALRPIRPQRTAHGIRRRTLANLPVIKAPVSAGAELVLDTCVYIELLEAQVANHSTV
jgi:hypothetical protein